MRTTERDRMCYMDLCCDSVPYAAAYTCSVEIFSYLPTHSFTNQRLLQTQIESHQYLFYSEN